ncbi:OTU domain-containing protein [Chlamydiota bacterium]
MSAADSSIPVSSGCTFVDWYVDDTIPGHRPLAPSIFVGRTYKSIFSPLEERGCETVIEVFLRVLIFAILPCVAIFAALLIPLGLITKSIGGCCASPPPAVPLLSDDSPVEQQDPLVVSAPPAPVYSRGNLARVKPAQEALKSINALLGGISVKKIDIDALTRAKAVLEGDENLRALSAVPLIRAETTDPISAVVDQMAYVNTRIKSLEFLHHFYSKTLVEEGEIAVPDNGDCLFQAFLELGAMDGSVAADALQERRDTMAWIKANCKENLDLQRRFVNSMAEHYQAKLQRLEDEQREVQGMLQDAFFIEEDMANRQQMELRLPLLQQEIDALHAIIAKISDAFGVAHNEKINFSAVKSLVDDYVAEMSKPGIHGGAVELYALSCRHEVCVQVYSKNRDGVKKEPYETINPRFVAKPARCFTHTNNHYNAYCPGSR